MTEQDTKAATEPPLDCWVGRDIVDRLRETGRRLEAAGYETYIGDAANEIENLRAMYDAQCQCTDEWAEKYRAEVERKADASLLARIAELEQALGVVNERLTFAQAMPNVEVRGWPQRTAERVMAQPSQSAQTKPLSASPA